MVGRVLKDLAPVCDLRSPECPSSRPSPRPADGGPGGLMEPPFKGHSPRRGERLANSWWRSRILGRRGALRKWWQRA